MDNWTEINFDLGNWVRFEGKFKPTWPRKEGKLTFPNGETFKG
jgi:hypothetical protein